MSPAMSPALSPAVSPAVSTTEHPARSLGGVVSHEDAALRWGMELVRPPTRAHVTVPRGCRRAADGVRMHQQDLAPDDVREKGGLLVTSPARTVVDLARTLPREEAVAVADSALRVGALTYPELVDAVGALAPANGRPRCREVLALVDPRCGSVLESLARVLFEDAGLRPFETQHVVRAGRAVLARVDFAWPEAHLVVEVDGFAFHADRSSYRSDRRRGNGLVLAGWKVLRFSWEDVLTRPHVVVGQVRVSLGR